MTMRTAKTAQEWINVQSMGIWQEDCKNGEIWYFSGEIWYLSHLELSPHEPSELMCALNFD